MGDFSKIHLDKISDIFLLIDNKDDMEQLLTDVCTKKELEAIYQRFKVAQLLKKGLTFVQIEERTGISSTTITRVSKCLKRGTGYNKMFDVYNLTLESDKE